MLRILINLGGATPRSATDVLSDIILSLNKKYCDNLARWLNTLLAQDGFPSPRITSQQKQQFIKLVLKEKANKRKLTESVMEFTSICRGIIKMENLPWFTIFVGKAVKCFCFLLVCRIFPLILVFAFSTVLVLPLVALERERVLRSVVASHLLPVFLHQTVN